MYSPPAPGAGTIAGPDADTPINWETGKQSVSTCNTTVFRAPGRGGRNPAPRPAILALRPALLTLRVQWQQGEGPCTLAPLQQAGADR